VLEELVGHGLVETDKPGQGKADGWWLATDAGNWWDESESL
jgi:hypothetical protein